MIKNRTIFAAWCMFAALSMSLGAKADSMLGKMSDPSFMGVKAKSAVPAPAPALASERWIIDVIAMVDGKVAAAATYGDAVYPSEALCESAVKSDVQLNANAATALDLLGKDNPGAKIAVVIACAMKVD